LEWLQPCREPGGRMGAHLGEQKIYPPSIGLGTLKIRHW